MDTWPKVEFEFYLFDSLRLHVHMLHSRKQSKSTIFQNGERICMYAIDLVCITKFYLDRLSSQIAPKFKIFNPKDTEKSSKSRRKVVDF